MRTLYPRRGGMRTLSTERGYEDSLSTERGYEDSLSTERGYEDSIQDPPTGAPGKGRSADRGSAECRHVGLLESARIFESIQ